MALNPGKVPVIVALAVVDPEVTDALVSTV